MSRLLLLAVGAFMLSSCGASQNEIDAAAVYYCEQQRLDNLLEAEGESPDLRAEVSSVTDRLVIQVESSGSPEGVWEALEEVDC